MFAFVSLNKQYITCPSVSFRGVGWLTEPGLPFPSVQSSCHNCRCNLLINGQIWECYWSSHWTLQQNTAKHTIFPKMAIYPFKINLVSQDRPESEKKTSYKCQAVCHIPAVGLKWHALHYKKYSETLWKILYYLESIKFKFNF